MASTVTTPIADKLKDIAADLAVTPAVKAYRWTPKALSGPGPFAVVELPDISRGEVLERETELGRRDWAFEFPVVFYFDLHEAEKTQSRAADVIEAWIKAVDANPTLSQASLVEEARVTDVETSYDLDKSRPLLVVETTVQVVAFVS